MGKPLTRKCHEEHNDTHCDIPNTLPTPFFWMNLPPRVIHKPIMGLSGSQGLKTIYFNTSKKHTSNSKTMNRCLQKGDAIQKFKHLHT